VLDALVESLGADLAAVLWQGSWARGEATGESDHDLVIIVRRTGPDVIERLAGVFAEKTGWSAYVKTEEELRQYPLTGRLQFQYGVQCLYGEFTPPPVTREGLLEDLRTLATQLSHEARYRLVHHSSDVHARAHEPTWGVRTARWMYHQTKATLMAMKAREMLIRGEYPVTRAELRSRTSDPTALALIDAVERWPELKSGFEQDILPLCRLIDTFTTDLVRWLSAEYTRPEGT
jgi:hypothetical protein